MTIRTIATVASMTPRPAFFPAPITPIISFVWAAVGLGFIFAAGRTALTGLVIEEPTSGEADEAGADADTRSLTRTICGSALFTIFFAANGELPTGEDDEGNEDVGIAG